MNLQAICKLSNYWDRARALTCLGRRNVPMPDRLRNSDLTVHIVFPQHSPDFATSPSGECRNCKDRGCWLGEYGEKLIDLLKTIRVGFG